MSVREADGMNNIHVVTIGPTETVDAGYLPGQAKEKNLVDIAKAAADEVLGPEHDCLRGVTDEQLAKEFQESVNDVSKMDLSQPPPELKPPFPERRYPGDVPPAPLPPPPVVICPECKGKKVVPLMAGAVQLGRVGCHVCYGEGAVPRPQSKHLYQCVKCPQRCREWLTEEDAKRAGCTGNIPKFEKVQDREQGGARHHKRRGSDDEVL